MSNVTQEDLNFSFEEIDDYNLCEHVMQDYSYNHTPASSYSNSYNSEYYNFVLKNDENQPDNVSEFYEPSSVGSDASSTAVFLSSDATSTAVLPSSNVSSAVSLPVKQLLHGMIKEKMRAEGRQETSLVFLPQDSSVNQLTPDEERKKLEKQLRNKDAARRSRQKKKEDEEKLLRDNMNLTARHEKLKQEVAKCKHFKETFEQFLSNHQCAISPRQDNGDKMCVETGGNKVYNDDELSNIVDFMTIYDDGQTPLPFSRGSKSQRVSAIVSHLQGDLPSEVVTSGTVYDAKKYNIDIQKNVFPGNLYNVANNEELYTGTGACGGTLLAGREEVGSETEMFNTENIGTNQLMPQGMSPLTDMVTQTNNSSVPFMKKSKPKLSAWSTDETNQSEADEALNFVRGICQPPEKKIRYE